MNHFDSLMFDMDGTLWDAVDSYCIAWNETLRQCGMPSREVTRQDLIRLMGTPLDGIISEIINGLAGDSRFIEVLEANERRIMPRLGGRLYPGVQETIKALASSHKLFMVSNCGKGGLPDFLKFTGLAPYFTDHISYGDTGCEKEMNISTLIKRHGLEYPLYIGDTMRDLQAAHAAGIPFAWAKYGFGKDISGQDFTLAEISDLPKLIS